MNEDQLYDAAEREMDLYRAEVARLRAAHEAEITSLTSQRNRVSDTADRLRGQLALYGEALREIARRTNGYDPGTNEHAVHQVAVSALALNGVPDDAGAGDGTPELLAPGDAARRLRVHPATLRALEKTGVLTPVRTPGGSRRYRAAEVEEVRRKRAGKDTG